MSSKRTHVARVKERIIEVRHTPIQDSTFKPKGFWYSVDGDWERWCKEERADWLEGEVYDVTLGAENIAYLRTVEEIDAFHHRFFGGWKNVYIDWARVAREFDGIEISPYQWDRRFDGVSTTWYYPWDCASGCVWRPKGIKVELQIVRATT